MADNNRPIPDEALADDLLSLRDAASRRADVQFNQAEEAPVDDNVAARLATVHQGDLETPDDTARQTGASQPAESLEGQIRSEAPEGAGAEAFARGPRASDDELPGSGAERGAAVGRGEGQDGGIEPGGRSGTVPAQGGSEAGGDANGRSANASGPDNAPGLNNFAAPQARGEGGPVGVSGENLVAAAANVGPNAVDDAGAASESAVLIVDALSGVLANDSDPDGGTLSVSAFDSTSAKGASIMVNADGSYSYDASASTVLNALGVGEATTDTFSYTVSDGQGGSSVATVTIDVTGTNDGPSAVVDVSAASENALHNVDAANGVLGNDSDPDTNDTLSVSAYDSTSAKGATVVVNPDGSYTYDPRGSATLNALTAGESTTDTFSYTASDGNGGTSLATVTINVTGSADGPSNVIIGTVGNDVLRGTNQADTIIGLTGNDRFYGGGGDDTFVVNQGDGIDRFYGQGGSDTIDATGASDIYTSSYSGSATVETINGNADSGTTIHGTSGNNTLNFSNTDLNNINAIDGGAGHDRIYGSSEADTIVGGSGNDRLYGNNGNDIITGGTGNDRLYGGNGGDTLNGEAGNDLAYGGNGDDVINGGAGNDRLYGDAGADTITGGTGNDYFYGGTGDDTFVVNQGDGIDRFYGQGGSDTIDATGANDIYTSYYNGSATVETINGNADSGTTIHGTSGNNTLNFSSTDLNNINAIDGGAGHDRIYGSSEADTIVGGTGNDRLYGRAGDDVIDGGTGNDRLYGEAGADTITGGDGNDRAYGGNDDDVISGGAGNDRLYGDAGADTITGGTGNDYFYGGGGDDTFVVNQGDGIDRFYGQGGTDTVDATGASDVYTSYYSGSSTVETINGQLAWGTTIHGTSGNNTLNFSSTDLNNINGIDGGAGNDRIYGSAEADTIIGGTGNDQLYGRAGDDAIDGGTGNDRLYGEAGADTITGGAGNDMMYGGDGDDTFVVNQGDGVDRFYGQGGSDTVDATGASDIYTSYYSGSSTVETINGQVAGGTTIHGTSGNNTLNFSNTDLNNISGIDGGAGNDRIYGNADADTISGGAGGDRLYGNAGNDMMTGGAGNDRLYGGAGDDTFMVNSGDGTDRIDGGVGWTDTIDLGSASGGPNAGNGWTMTSGTSFTENANGLVFDSADASGTIVLDDGTQVTFQNTEEITW